MTFIWSVRFINNDGGTARYLPFTDVGRGAPSAAYNFRVGFRLYMNLIVPPAPADEITLIGSANAGKYYIEENPAYVRNGKWWLGGTITDYLSPTYSPANFSHIGTPGAVDAWWLVDTDNNGSFETNTMIHYADSRQEAIIGRDKYIEIANPTNINANAVISAGKWVIEGVNTGVDSVFSGVETYPFVGPDDNWWISSCLPGFERIATGIKASTSQILSLTSYTWASTWTRTYRIGTVNTNYKSESGWTLRNGGSTAYNVTVRAWMDSTMSSTYYAGSTTWMNLNFQKRLVGTDEYMYFTADNITLPSSLTDGSAQKSLIDRQRIVRGRIVPMQWYMADPLCSALFKSFMDTNISDYYLTMQSIDKERTPMTILQDPQHDLGIGTKYLSFASQLAVDSLKLDEYRFNYITTFYGIDGLELFKNTKHLVLDLVLTGAEGLEPIRNMHLVDIVFDSFTSGSGSSSYYSTTSKYAVTPATYDFAPLIAGSQNTLQSFKIYDLLLYENPSDLFFLLSMPNLTTVSIGGILNYSSTLDTINKWMNTASFKVFIWAMLNKQPIPLTTFMLFGQNYLINTPEFYDFYSKGSMILSRSQFYQHGDVNINNSEITFNHPANLMSGIDFPDSLYYGGDVYELDWSSDIEYGYFDHENNAVLYIDIDPSKSVHNYFIDGKDTGISSGVNVSLTNVGIQVQGIKGSMNENLTANNPGTLSANHYTYSVANRTSSYVFSRSYEFQYQMQLTPSRKWSYGGEIIPRSNARIIYFVQNGTWWIDDTIDDIDNPVNTGLSANVEVSTESGYIKIDDTVTNIPSFANPRLTVGPDGSWSVLVNSNWAIPTANVNGSWDIRWLNTTPLLTSNLTANAGDYNYYARINVAIDNGNKPNYGQVYYGSTGGTYATTFRDTDTTPGYGINGYFWYSRKTSAIIDIGHANVFKFRNYSPTVAQIAAAHGRTVLGQLLYQATAQTPIHYFFARANIDGTIYVYPFMVNYEKLPKNL
jgi:hypothetical protein